MLSSTSTHYADSTSSATALKEPRVTIGKNAPADSHTKSRKITAPDSSKRGTRRHRANSRKHDSLTINVDHPVGLPQCIPATAANAFFSATASVQRQLILDASEPSIIKYNRAPVPQSALRQKTEGTVCLCRDMQMCPLAASSTPLEDSPNFDGLTCQFYPTDEGWWNMRDLVLRLAQIGGQQQ